MKIGLSLAITQFYLQFYLCENKFKGLNLMMFLLEVKVLGLPSKKDVSLKLIHRKPILYYLLMTYGYL